MKMPLTTTIIHNQDTIQVPLNPFFHRTNWSLVQKIKVSILFLTLFPIRVVLMSVLMLLAWILATIATIKIPAETPLSRWRRVIRWIIAKVVMRTCFFVGGFYWINVKGKQANRKDAPILVVAPHSSLADVVPWAMTGGPSIVLKADVANNCFYKTLVSITQPLYVNRDLSNSRAEAVRQIIKRSRSEMNWPQIYIYPEGTCSNRSCLITFNKGAFNPGVSIQPVVIRYPNHNDTFTWTFDSLTRWQFLYLCCSQFYLRCDIEFLPVYHPNDGEKRDSVLFARNVRALMAATLGIPVLDYIFNDGVVMQRMIKKDQLRRKFQELSKLRQKLNMMHYTEMNVSRRAQSLGNNWERSPHEFINEFGLEEANQDLVTNLFTLFNQRNIGKIDLREYFVYSTILNHNVQTNKLLPPLFEMYKNGQTETFMTQDGFKKLMQGVFGMSEDYASIYFRRDLEDNKLSISREQFDQKIQFCLDYLRLYSLEATGVVSVYPLK